MIALKSSESKASFNVLVRSCASTLGIVAATPKARSRTHTAPRKPLCHQRAANGTVRNCIGRIGIDRGLLRLAFVSRRTNDANETPLSFQPEPIQRYSNDNGQNGAMSTDSVPPHPSKQILRLRVSYHVKTRGQESLRVQSLFLCPGS